MKSAAIGICLVTCVASTSYAGDQLPSARYDRNKDGKIDKDEAAIWLIHEQDRKNGGQLAKYDVNLNGQYDPAEAEKMSRDSIASRTARLKSVELDALFFSNKTTTEADKVAATRPPPPSPTPEASSSPKSGCEQQQRLFVRRDRLDTYQYRDSVFVEGVKTRAKATGASVSLSRDDIEGVNTAVVNGRVSYVLTTNDPDGHCFDAGSDDPYKPRDFNSPFLFGTVMAVWADAQGTLNAPRAKSERSALKTGLDAQATIGGGPLFDLQYLIATPYGQTDFRGEARVYGFTAAWEPFAPKMRLGGTIDAPPTEYLDWYWQVRAEADVKRVDEVGATALTRGDYVWGGAVARLRLTPFPDRSKFDVFATPLFPELVGLLYADITVNYHREFDRRIDAFLWSAEVGVNVTPANDVSVSVRYTDGVDKDTLIKARQYLMTLNYKL